jgi:DNA polymerase (family 10)
MRKQSTLFPEDKIEVLEELELDEAEKIVGQVKSQVEFCCERIEIVGSIRRKKPNVKDVDFVVVTKSDLEWYKLSQELRRMKTKNINAGNQIIKTLYPYGDKYFQLDFYRATQDTFGILKLIRTGSADHNMWLAQYAISKGFRIKFGQGLMKDNKIVAGKTEKDVFDALDLPYSAPEERESVEDWGKPK